MLAGLVLWTLVSLLPAQGFDLPVLSGPVVDQANIIDAPTRSTLDSLLRRLNQSTGIQFQILTVQSLDGLPIESYSIRVVDAWQLGTKSADKGLLFLVALNERKMRFEVGQGLEGDFPDVMAKRIIDDVVKPYFQQSKFSEGIRLAVKSALIYVAPDFAGEITSTKRTRGYRSATNPKLWEFILFLVIILLTTIFQGPLRRHGFWVGGGRGWSGGGGFSGGGGGWSGGGGGFSGGGASGGW